MNNKYDKVLIWLYLLLNSVSCRRVIFHWKNSERDMLKEIALNRMICGTIIGHLAKPYHGYSVSQLLLLSFTILPNDALISFLKF